MTIGLYRFNMTPRALVSKDLLNLRSRLGGTIGQIKCGLDTQDVVKVNEHVYVSARKPAAALAAMVAMGRADIHTIDHPATLQLIADRMRQTYGETEK